MLDHMHVDLQVDIIRRLPVKSLIRLRSVSKRWKSLIDSTEFRTDYSVRRPYIPRQHMLMRYVEKHKEKYVSIVDDDSFPQHKSVITVPESVNQLIKPRVVGSSHGLFCFLSKFPRYITMAVIWNPSIRKSVSVDVPNNDVCGYPLLGFGVCPRTSDPKIIRIDQSRLLNKCCDNWQVEVFTLSSRAWRSPLTNLPSKQLRIKWYDSQVVVDRFIYWYGCEYVTLCDIIKVIISFDLTTEEFKPIYLPDKLERQCYKYSMYKLRESLAVLQSKTKAEREVIKVWIMDHGVSKSFKKLYTINLPYASVREVVGFGKNDQLIMERGDDNEEPVELVAYETCSKRINNLGIYGDYESFFLSSYTESLLLLDQ